MFAWNVYASLWIVKTKIFFVKIKYFMNRRIFKKMVVSFTKNLMYKFHASDQIRTGTDFASLKSLRNSSDCRSGCFSSEHLYWKHTSVAAFVHTHFLIRVKVADT